MFYSLLVFLPSLMHNGPHGTPHISVKPGLNDPLSIQQIEDILAPEGLFFGAQAVGRIFGESVPHDFLARVQPKAYTLRRAQLAKREKRAVTLDIPYFRSPLTPYALYLFFSQHNKGDVFTFGANPHPSMLDFLKNYQEHPQPGWRETSFVPIPDTIRRDMICQLDFLVLYIMDTTFPDVQSIPHVYQMAIQEYDGKREALERLLTADLCAHGHDFIDAVSQLSLVRLFVPTFAQLLYTMTLCRLSGSPFPDTPFVTSTVCIPNYDIEQRRTVSLHQDQFGGSITPMLTSPLGLPGGAGIAFSQKLI